MLCPQCLKEVAKFSPESERDAHRYKCPDCGRYVPTLYVEDNRGYTPAVLSVIAHQGHGKTTFLAALFFALEVLEREGWPRFHMTPHDADAFDTITFSVDKLRRGRLPDPTSKLFPKPAMLRLCRVPQLGDFDLLAYDTCGEALQTVQDITQWVGYLCRAPHIMFLIDLSTIRGEDELRRFLVQYRVALQEQGYDPRNQTLVVVLTKCDCLPKGVVLPKSAQDALRGSPSEIVSKVTLETISDDLLGMVQKLYPAFVKGARQAFRQVVCMPVSALGSPPNDQALSVEPRPRGAVLPLLWLLTTARENQDTVRYGRILFAAARGTACAALFGGGVTWLVALIWLAIRDGRDCHNIKAGFELLKSMKSVALTSVPLAACLLPLLAIVEDFSGGRLRRLMVAATHGSLWGMLGFAVYTVAAAYVNKTPVENSLFVAAIRMQEGVLWGALCGVGYAAIRRPLDVARNTHFATMFMVMGAVAAFSALRQEFAAIPAIVAATVLVFGGAHLTRDRERVRQLLRGR